ncbi:MAG: V-type ATP synthase subunit I, partial [Candidatus Marinimicrobia bacterium]|nr:V-type ATP synthase subunit I [Candidatus Neomarinimicrobiota bacterium]
SEFQADILAYQEKIKKRYEFANVEYGMENEESISYLQGFCPEESTDIIKKEADKESWGYVFEEPDDLSEVPTLIKNPRWIKIIDPIFKFMGTVPGYQEYDISMWFLIFFSLFFAMLIGDAGYGFIFIVLTLWVRRKMPKAPSEPFVLMYILGGATVVWGLLSGTWFGLERIAQIPFLKKCIIPSISSFDLSKHSFNDNQNFMMHLCFLIGAIHLTVAHLTSALRNKKSLRALSQIGWIGIVWSLYFLAETLVLRHEFPKMAKWSLLIGFFLALVFSNPQKNIIKGIASTLGSLPLDIIGGFSDVVSYLRLFAVGYATVMVAYSFNTMALGNGINNIISGFIAAFILFLGHGLNIILGAMSIVVHGIRLNMLEFSGHLGLEWSGKEYKPFKE